MTEKLKQNLEELKSELKTLNSEDPKLQKLATDIDDALAETPEVSESLVQTLQHTAEEFEVNHPQLTAIINNVMTSLSNIGI